MKTRPIFVIAIATLLLGVLTAGKVSAQLPNATIPNATIPNATIPNATMPNATTPPAESAASGNGVGESARSAVSWPQWRGPLGTGASNTAKPPVEWSETKNVHWKVELPGKGHSSPIVWGDRVYLTAAVPHGDKLEPKPDTAPGAHDNSLVYYRHKFVALALERDTGKIVWQVELAEALPHEGGHYTGSLASASPMTDGKHLFAYFGSYGLYCLNLQGQVQWKVDLGKMNTKHGHGEGSSPTLYKNFVAVNWDHEKGSFIAVFDKRSGKRLWKVDREEVTSWATPIVVPHNGQDQLIVSGTERVRAYDLKTGRVIWQCGGLSHNIVATPVAGDGMVFVASSYEKQSLMAIRLKGSEGDITGTDQIVWSRIRGTPYVPSPLLYEGSLYFLRHYQGILSRVDGKTGNEKLGPFRLGALRDIYASPVAADDRIYIVGRYGATMVISHGEEPTALAVNRLNDTFSATPALLDNEIILRGERFLYNIRESKE